MSDKHIHNVLEKSVKLTLELEKWKSGFDEKLSSLEIELQNEKNANAELKKKLEDHIQTNGITLAELLSTMDAKDKSLEEKLEKFVTEKIGDMETKSSSDAKDKSLKEKLETFVMEKIGNLETKSSSEAKDKLLEEKLEKLNEELGKTILKKDCEWGSWSDWEPCTQNCDGGNQQRKRLLLAPAQFGGQCTGSEFDIRIAPPVSLELFILKIPLHLVIFKIFLSIL